MSEDFHAYSDELRSQHERAQVRARRAGERAAQLQQWVEDLAGRRAGALAPEGDARVRDAAVRTEEAIRAAELAAAEARAGYRRAAQVVRRAARMHERAAELGVGDVEWHRRRARELRAEAAEDEKRG